MTDEPKTFDLDGLSCVLVPDGGVEKLKTMDCDEIERLLAGAWNTLACSGELLMANCLIDLVSPIILERERVLYRWVLASEHPDAPGHTYEVWVENLSGQPTVDPKELRPDIFTPGRLCVSAKRIKIT